jgi:hypothetical protein
MPIAQFIFITIGILILVSPSHKILKMFQLFIIGFNLCVLMF